MTVEYIGILEIDELETLREVEERIRDALSQAHIYPDVKRTDPVTGVFQVELSFTDACYRRLEDWQEIVKILTKATGLPIKLRLFRSESVYMGAITWDIKLEPAEEASQ